MSMKRDRAREDQGGQGNTHRGKVQVHRFSSFLWLSLRSLLVLIRPVRLSLFGHVRILQLAQVKRNRKLVHVNVIKTNCSFETVFFQGILPFASLFTTESCQGHNPLHHLFITHFTIFLHGILPPTRSAIKLHHIKSC